MNLPASAACLLGIVLPVQAQVTPCQVQKIAASDGTGLDEFGNALAASGDRLLVGAWHANPNPGGITPGAAYVFRRSGPAWLEIAKLEPSDPGSCREFAHSVALNGTTALVGASRADGLVAESGAAYVFDGSSGSWTQSAKLVASDGQQYDRFGTAVALSPTICVIGATQRPPGGTETLPGCAYVFESTPFGWVQAAKLVPSDGAMGDEFGFCVATDAGRVFVGTPFHDNERGAMYVFERVGGVWTETAKLTTTTADLFGWSADAEGGRILVGAPGEGSDGVAHLFEWGESGWSEAASLSGDLLLGSPSLGRSIALAGNRAVMGNAQYTFSSSTKGTACVFEEQDGVWSHAATLIANDAASGDKLGSSVCFSGDQILTGTPFGNPELVGGAGCVYSFELTPDGQPLAGCPGAVSLGLGGSQSFALKPGPTYAGQLYLILGTMSGTSPGFSYQGFSVPLNVDPYFMLSVKSPGNPPLLNSLGTLDGNGEATALFQLAPGTPTSALGLTLHHAYGVIDPLTFALSYVSNTVPVGLVP